MKKLILIIFMLPLAAMAQEVLGDSLIIYGGGSFEGIVSMDSNRIIKVDTAVDAWDAVPLWQIQDSIGTASDTSFWSRTQGHIWPSTVTDSVGIGTGSPTELLDVSGNSLLDGDVDIGGNLDVTEWANIVDSVRVGGSLYVTDSVGIGTGSPTEMLDVVGSIQLSDTLSLSGTTELYETSSGHAEYDGTSLIFNTTNIGTTLGSYNTFFGSGNFAADDAPTYNFASGYRNAYSATGAVEYNGMFGRQNAYSATGIVSYNGIFGRQNAYSATGNVYYNGIFGSQNAYSATGIVSYNGIFGYRNAYSATGNVKYNGIFGYLNAYSATGDVSYNGIFGYLNAYSATGSVQYNGIFGQENAYSSTGNVKYNGIFGYLNAYSATGDVTNSLLIGYRNADSATTVTNTIAVGGEVFKNSKINLTNAIGLGYQAGINTTFTGAAIFGTQGQPTTNNQVVIGSEFYTGGILLDTNTNVSGTFDLNLTQAVDTIETTLTDSDTNIPTSGAVFDYVNSFRSTYEKQLADSETNIAVGFTISANSLVFLNGSLLKVAQWSGEGTTTLVLSLSTKQYDNFFIKQ